MAGGRDRECFEKAKDRGGADVHPGWAGFEFAGGGVRVDQAEHREQPRGEVAGGAGGGAGDEAHGSAQEAGLMSTRAERRRMEKAASKDTRYCYGANCTWHGPISETGVTRPIAGMHRLPCCPLCGGMLMEFPTAEEWWGPAEDYEAGTGKGGRAHPGYVAMMKWQVEQKVCFPINQTRNGVRELRDAYFAATGVHVPLDSDPEAA